MTEFGAPGDLDFSRLPQQMPQSARWAVIVGFGIAEPASGLIASLPDRPAMVRLGYCMGHSDLSATRKAVAQAEAWRLMLRHRKAQHTPPDLFVARARLVAGLCEVCGRPAQRIRDRAM